VLGFDKPAVNGQAASIVIGRPGPALPCNPGGLGRTTLCGPWGVAIADTPLAQDLKSLLGLGPDLFVSDTSNNRVLRFNHVPL
jgi:hypothetical protein